MLEYYVEIALSAIAILVFAVDRFSIPPSDPKAGDVTYRVSRSTTTAASYYTAESIYVAIALGVFAFLLLSPLALARLNRLLATTSAVGELPAWARESPPLLVALILTVLLPKIPILSSIDEWFRIRLQRMAAIPHEVRRLTAELRRAPFRVKPEHQKQLTEAMVDKGFEAADIRFEEGSTPHYLWTKLAMLMSQLDGWEADARFASYVLTYPNEFNALKLRYEALLPRARRCFGLLRDLATDPGSGATGGAVYAYRDDFVREVQGLLNGVHEAISNAVLLCELTQRARVSQLIKLGFSLEPWQPRRLTLNELLGLFTGLTVVYAFGFVVMHRLNEPSELLDPHLFILAILIAAIYCIAVWCAIYPKSRWSHARRRSENGRPWGWYLLSGLAATAAGMLVGFMNQLVTHRFDLARAWGAYWQVSPWVIMTFATAYGLAFLTDDEPRDGYMDLLRADRLRWVEALGMTIVLTITAWLVHSFLVSMHESALMLHAADPSVQVLPVRALRDVELLTMIIGFAIGFLVPTWYRSTPPDPQSEVRVPIAASASGARQ
jgi:hypothetical protein